MENHTNMNKRQLLNNLRTLRDCIRSSTTPPKESIQAFDSAISVIEKTSLQTVNAAIYRKELRDKVISTKGAMILDGYEPEDSCIKFMNELIDEL
jgi:hypothetical protein